MRALTIVLGLLLGLVALENHRPPSKKHAPRKARETHRIAVERPRR